MATSTYIVFLCCTQLHRIYATRSKNNVEKGICSGYLPLEHVARTRKVKFMRDRLSSSCHYIRSVVSLPGKEELNVIAVFYNVDVPCLIKYC